MKIATEDFGINLNPCILWQYNDAHHLHNLLQGEHDFFDFCTNYFWENYRNLVFNVGTANRYGLDRWAEIIGMSTYYAKTTNSEVIDTEGNRWTQAQVDARWREWQDSGGMTDNRIKVKYEIGEKGETFGVVTNDFLRRAILARFYLLDSNGSCDAINTYLSLLFGWRESDGEPKVVCREPTNTDGLNGTPYYWELNRNTGIGSYKYLKDASKFANPMEISYDLPGYENFTYIELRSAGKWNELIEKGYSEDELYILLELCNRRMYLPHPAGVRINGQDADKGLAFLPDVFLGFELEAVSGQPIPGPTDFSRDLKIGPLNWSRMRE